MSGSAKPHGQSERPGFLGEVIGFAGPDGIYPIRRAEMHRACLMLGETPRQADASAFASYVRPLSEGSPGRVDIEPITAEQAVALLA